MKDRAKNAFGWILVVLTIPAGIALAIAINRLMKWMIYNVDWP